MGFWKEKVGVLEKEKVGGFGEGESRGFLEKEKVGGLRKANKENSKY